MKKGTRSAREKLGHTDDDEDRKKLLKDSQPAAIVDNDIVRHSFLRQKNYFNFYHQVFAIAL